MRFRLIAALGGGRCDAKRGAGRRGDQRSDPVRSLASGGPPRFPAERQSDLHVPLDAGRGGWNLPWRCDLHVGWRVLVLQRPADRPESGVRCHPHLDRAAGPRRGGPSHGVRLGRAALPGLQVHHGHLRSCPDAGSPVPQPSAAPPPARTGPGVPSQPPQEVAAAPAPSATPADDQSATPSPGPTPTAEAVAVRTQTTAHDRPSTTSSGLPLPALVAIVLLLAAVAAASGGIVLRRSARSRRHPRR